MLLLMVRGARAQAYDPDEARDVRIVRSASGTQVDLSWQPPSALPDDYIVRRCTLSALRGGAFGAPYFGNCVATAVIPTSWSEATPTGNVFYLVTGSTSGAEGSLGSSWNGQFFVPRAPTDCAVPEVSQPLTVTLSLSTPQLVCGTTIAFSFPGEDLTYVSSSCTGVEAGFFGAGNGLVPGRVIHSCGSATGRFGSGEVTRIEFQRSDCPFGKSGVHVTRCQVLVGSPDCGTAVSQEQTCIVDIP